MSSLLVRLCLLMLVGVGVIPVFGQEDTRTPTVRLDLPNISLVDQDGAPHRFAQDLIGGKVVVVSFLFTGCATICSPVGATMGALDKILALKLARRSACFP